MEYVKIKDIKENKNNPRYIKEDAFHKLVASIREFPEMLELRPIIVNEEMVTLGGNMRLKACKEAGLKEVPVVVAKDLTEQQQKEFIVKDNLGYGEWDWEMLANDWDLDELNHWGLKANVWDETNQEEQEKKYEKEKRVAIEVREEDYKELLGLVAYWKGRGRYVGGMVMDYFKAEKKNLGDNWN